MKSSIVIFLGLFLCFSHTYSVQPSQPKNEDCAVCSTEFDPVCCTLTNGISITTGNVCLCTKCSNGTVASNSQCNNPGACICPKNLDPVCCRLPNGLLETRNNGCLCNCDSGTIETTGECESIDPTPSPESDGCICPTVFDPVCCKLPNGITQTESNSCACACEKGTVVSEGVCTPEPCICTLEFEPVCCENKNGGKVVLNNRCLCESCGSGKVISIGDECPGEECKCPEIYKPVCCKLPNGNIELSSNGCKCKCSGGQVISDKKCPRNLS